MNITVHSTHWPRSPRRIGPLLGIATMMTAFVADAEPALPRLEQQQGPGQHWTLERTVDADALLSLDRDVALEPDGASLKLDVRSAGDGGYAELRASPMLELAPGDYVFSVWVRGQSEQRPHIEIFGFDANDTPARLGIAFGPAAGRFEWQYVEASFTVSADTRRVRIGMGVAQSEGELWYTDPQLRPAEDAAAEPIVPPTDSSDGTDSAETWNAPWIWVPDTLGERGIVFSKTIHLDATPASAIVQVTADDSYELRINGELVGSDADWRTIELIDVTEHLHAGDNRIEISVVNFGGPGGALLEGVAFYPDGQTQRFGTDGDWTSVTATGQRPTQTMVIGRPPTEPWGVVTFTRYQPPTALHVSLLEPIEPVEPGGALRLRLRLPQALDTEAIERLEFSFTDAHTQRRHPLSGLSPRLAMQEGNVLVIELAVSRFAGPGDYLWRIESPRFVLAPSDETQRRVTVLPTDDLPEPSSTTWPGGRVTGLKVNGQDAPAVVYSTMTPSAQRFINWRVTGSHLYEIYKPFGLIWTGPGTFDTEDLERELLQILDADPQASVYLKCTTDAPSWWLKQHPDDRFVSSAGWTGQQSFASDAWRDDVADGFVTIIEQLRQRPVGRYVVGMVPLAFRGGEFQLWGEDGGEHDVSPVAKAAFTKWQQDQGFDNPAELPHPALVMPFQPGPEYAEVRRRYFTFLAERGAGNLVHIAQRVKQRLPDLSIGMYYGYLTEHAVWPQRLFFAGHLGIERIIREAPIDMLGCPASYEFRGLGQPISFMFPETSAALHGITPVLENDMRTYLIDSDEPGAAEGLLDSFADIEKLRLLAASRGAGVRYLALFNTADSFQSPPLLLHTAQWNQIVPTLTPNPMGDNREIALVLDPQALIGATELPGIEAMAPMFLHQVRDPLARTGRPYAVVLMSDWREHAETWDTVVVPLPVLLDDSARAALTSAFGELPDITDSDGLLVLSREPDASFVTSDLAELRDHLATPDAKAAGVDTIWYVGGNFTATITGNQVKLKRR